MASQSEVRKQYAGGICFVGIITIGLMAAGLGTMEWTVADITLTNNTNCVATRKLGLFRFAETKEGCLTNIGTSCSVFDPGYLSFTYGLQYAVIAFCALSLIFAFVAIAVAAFNICSNPYEYYLSPVAMLAYDATGLVMSLLAVILYTVLFYTQLFNPLLMEVPEAAADSSCVATNVYGDQGYVTDSSYFGFSFFLVVVSIPMYMIGMGLAILSDRDVVTKCFKKKEPANENKGDDVMMF